MTRSRGDYGKAASTALSRAAVLLAALLAFSAASAGAAFSASRAEPPAPAPAKAFSVVAASFVSPDSGFALGGAAGCEVPAQPCAARLLATVNGGRSWRHVPVPPVVVGRSVISVLFATRRDGWLYGPGLWSTHDGGARWRRLSVGGAVLDMAAGAGEVYAEVSAPSQLGPEKLYRSPVGSDAWARVGRLTSGPRPNGGLGDAAGLAVSGRSAWFGSNSTLWTNSGGGRWHRIAFSCLQRHYSMIDIAAASPRDVDFLCIAPPIGEGGQANAVLKSADGGATVHPAGGAPGGGCCWEIAMPPGRARVISEIANDPVATIARTGNAGRTWAWVNWPREGILSSLAYVSPAVGWVVAGPGSSPDGSPLPYGSLLRTTNDGLSWHKVGV
jgi:hypothetical protein